MRAYAGLAGQYDAFTGDIPYESFADFYERLFAEYGLRPRLLLDLACGTGTLCAIMARRGYDMTAADASEDMLAEARDKLCGGGFEHTPLLLCQDMRALDLYGTVDAVYSSLDSFNYLSGAELERVLERLQLFIEPGGLLVFDVNTAERLRSLDGQVFVDEDEEALCLWRAEFDAEEACIRYGMDIFTRAGRLWRREQEEHVEYAHEEGFLLGALERTGYRDVRVFRDGPQHEQGRVFYAARSSGKGMIGNG